MARFLVFFVSACVFLFLAISFYLQMNPMAFIPVSWEKCGQGGSLAVKMIASADDRGEKLFAGLATGSGDKGGLIQSNDGGTTWTVNDTVPTSNDVTSFCILPGEQSLYFLSLFDNRKNGFGGIYRSVDDGHSWEQLPPAIVPDSDFRKIIRTEFESGQRLLAGTVNNGVCCSDDRGMSWRWVNEGLASLAVQDLAVDPFDSRRVYCPTLQGLYLSEDSGEAWRAVTVDPAAPQTFVLTILPHPAMKGRLYLIARPPGERSDVWRSDDHGITWQKCGHQGTFAEFHPRCLAFDARHADRIYIGTVFDGVFRSDNAGKSWFPVNENLPIVEQNIIVHSLFLSTGSTPPQLIAGTDAAGQMFRSSLVESFFHHIVAWIRARPIFPDQSYQESQSTEGAVM